MSNALAIMKSTVSDEFNWNFINWFHISRYVEAIQQRIYRAEILGNKRKVRDSQRILVHSKQSITDFREKLVMQLKVPETDGGKYTYKNLELVHYKCGQYWKDWTKRCGNKLGLNNRRECEKEIQQFRLAGVI